MDNMTDKRDAAIRQAVEETLQPARIRRVTVKEDVGHDGDPIYRIFIILDRDEEELDTRKTIRLWEAVLDALEKGGYEVRFPVFTFMTPSEAKNEAA